MAKRSQGGPVSNQGNPYLGYVSPSAVTLCEVWDAGFSAATASAQSLVRLILASDGQYKSAAGETVGPPFSGEWQAIVAAARTLKREEE